MSNKDGLVDLRAIIKECDRIKNLFPTVLSHTNIGKGISLYSNGEHSYHTITIASDTRLEIVKVSFHTNGNTEISIDNKYISQRSLKSIVKRLKKITGDEEK